MNPCYWCRLVPGDTIDHLIPRSQGGTDDRRNLVEACFSCNARKRDRTPAEYGAWLRQRAAIMATVCPRCGSGPGEDCWSDGMQRSTSPHTARREAAVA